MVNKIIRYPPTENISAEIVDGNFVDGYLKCAD